MVEGQGRDQHLGAEGDDYHQQPPRGAWWPAQAARQPPDSSWPAARRSQRSPWPVLLLGPRSLQLPSPRGRYLRVRLRPPTHPAHDDVEFGRLQRRGHDPKGGGKAAKQHQSWRQRATSGLGRAAHSNRISSRPMQRLGRSSPDERAATSYYPWHGAVGIPESLRGRSSATRRCGRRLGRRARPAAAPVRRWCPWPSAAPSRRSARPRPGPRRRSGTARTSR
jgi:hypothetical protein